MKRRLVKLRETQKNELEEILSAADAHYKREDYQQAWQRYQEAAEAGLVLAYHKLGQMVLNGRGCGVDVQEAVNWLARGAKRGHPTCLGEIARIIDLSGDLERAEDYWASFFSSPLESMDDGALIFSYFHERRQRNHIPYSEMEVVGREAAFGHALVFAAELLERTRDNWTPEDQEALELSATDLINLLPPEGQELVLARFACRARLERRLRNA